MGRGGRFMMSGWPGSWVSARAGRLSVTKFIHKIWMGSNGSGMAKSTATVINKISSKLALSKKSMQR